MKSKSGKSARTPSKVKSRKKTISNKTLISTETDFENLFEQMKNDIFDEIQKAAKEKFEEHKTKIINFINDNKVNNIIEPPALVDQVETGIKKTTKSKRTNKKGKLNKSFDQIVVNQDTQAIEEENDIKLPPIETKITTKKKRTVTKRKKTKKKISSKTDSIIQGGEKTDISSNDISKLSGTAIKTCKSDKKGNGKSTGDEGLTGKKRKRSKEKENFVFLFNSEPEPNHANMAPAAAEEEEEKKEEKKPKKTKGKKKSKSKSTRKTK